MYRIPLVALGAALVYCGPTTPAAAQDEPLALEEVLVTANRRVESLQEIPMSVTAFTGDFFKDTGATDLADLEE